MPPIHVLRRVVVSGSRLAWLAGLLEGEGSFQKPAPSDPGRPRISIQMTDRDVIDRVAKMFDVRYVSSTERRRKRNWKPCYAVILRGWRAVELMKVLRPHMGKRRQRQIDEAIRSYAPRRTPLTEDRQRKVWSALQDGQSILEIAKSLRMSRKTVRRIRDAA